MNHTSASKPSLSLWFSKGTDGQAWTKPFYQIEITLKGPFHKSLCAGVLTLSGLNFTLGMKHYPDKGEINVWFSFIKD